MARGLCPRVYQSGETDHRGSLAKCGPRYLRWALIEADRRRFGLTNRVGGGVMD